MTTIIIATEVDQYFGYTGGEFVSFQLRIELYFDI